MISLFVACSLLHLSDELLYGVHRELSIQCHVLDLLRRQAVGVARGTGDSLLVMSTDLGVCVALWLLAGRHVALIGEKGHLYSGLGQDCLDVL